MRSKLGVGTVQFGMDYGVSNTGGRTPQQEVREILDVAATAGLVVIDTAPAYGDSESVIGNTITPGHAFRIVTKIPKIAGKTIGTQTRNLVKRTFDRSLENLNCASVYGLLVHDANDLLKDGAEELMETLYEFRSQGRVAKVGVSVYDATEIDAIVGRFPIDLIQLPVSIIDQRLLKSGHLARMAAGNVEIHSRSAFLQGLLLMKKGSWPERFRPFFPLLNRFHEFAEQRNLTPLQIALGFVQSISEVSQIICGTNSAAQMRELVDGTAINLDLDECRSLAVDDIDLVDPRFWVN